MEHITWIEEYSTLLLRNGCSVLHHREACRSSGAVMVIHRNLEESTLEVRVRGIDPEARAVAPRDL